jgi:hypothetical protein
MAVGTFTQPDHETQAASAYKDALDNSIAVMSRVGALFAPHEQDTPDMTVRLDAGALPSGTGVLEVTAQSTYTLVAPVSNPRIDRVVIDAATGVVSVIQGTEASSPVPPNITTGKLPICQISLATDTTEITNADITDERLLGGGSGSSSYQDILVSDLYFTTNNYADSAAVALAKGYGTWIRWGAGRFPVCFNSGDSDFNLGEKTGGSKTKSLSHSHTVSAHVHNISNAIVSITTGLGEIIKWIIDGTYPPVIVTDSGGGGDTGAAGSASQDVLNPYIVMYAWKRTA